MQLQQTAICFSHVTPHMAWQPRQGAADSEAAMPIALMERCFDGTDWLVDMVVTGKGGSLGWEKSMHAAWK